MIDGALHYLTYLLFDRFHFLILNFELFAEGAKLEALKNCAVLGDTLPVIFWFLQESVATEGALCVEGLKLHASWSSMRRACQCLCRLRKSLPKLLRFHFSHLSTTHFPGLPSECLERSKEGNHPTSR